MTVVRRILSGTPLEKSHQRAQRADRIAFDAFRRERYPEPALALAADQLQSFAAGEYEVVGSFSRLTAALAFNGAPFDLVSRAAEIPADEIRHADYMLRMASLCAAKEASLRIDPEALRGNWTKPLDLETLDALMIGLPAISETLAFAMLTKAKQLSRDPVVRRLYASVLGDELRHLRLGWYYLKWREPQWSRAERQRAADVAAEILIDVEPIFWVGRDAPRGSKLAARSLGVLDSKTLRKLIRHAVEREIVPGLDALGLGASQAWRVRRRAR